MNGFEMENSVRKKYFLRVLCAHDILIRFRQRQHRILRTLSWARGYQLSKN